jgi:F0F1-type ATP synthase membrane subunit b/b'
MRAAAAAEQAAIAEKMLSLPAELEALRKAGAEEVAAEESRIRKAAEAERERLLEVTRRDISTQLKLAERALMKQAADLAVAVASERVKTTITDADQIRLVDRYLVQVAK